jgi:hypothetical protein
MKKFSVSLHIHTSEASVDELADIMGLKLSPSSHSKGQVGGDGRPFKMTVGVFEVDSEGNDLARLIQRLIDKLDFSALASARQTFSDVAFAISIGSFFDTANCSLNISANQAALLGQHEIGIMISCYPSESDTA